jgi:transcription termination factor NusB
MHNSTQGIAGNLIVVDNPNNPIRIDKSLMNNGKLEDTTLLSILTDSMENNSVLFKFSQYINTWMRKEFEIGKEFFEMASYLPHFMYSICFIADYPVNIFKNTNVLYNPYIKPPDVFEQTNTRREIALFKYIDDADTFGQYMAITENMFKVNEIYRQIVIAMYVAQTNIGFCHNDLHADNVLLATCDPDIMFLYILPNNNNIIVETFGKIAVIIDYGFSYTSKLDNLNVMTDTYFADEGLFPVYQDFKTDMRTFLVRMTNESFFKREKNMEMTKMLKDYVQSTASTQFKLDEETGWLERTKKNFVDEIQNEILGYVDSEVCDLFSDTLCFYSFLTSIFQLTTVGDLRKESFNTFNRETIKQIVIDFNSQWILIEKNFSRFSRKRSNDCAFKLTALTICDRYLVSDNTCYAFQCAIETFFRVLLNSSPPCDKAKEFASSFSNSMHEKYSSFDLSDVSGIDLFSNIMELSKMFDEKLGDLTKHVIEKNAHVNDLFQKHVDGIDFETPESILRTLMRFSDNENLIKFISKRSIVCVIDTVKRVHKVVKPDTKLTLILNSFKTRTEQLKHLTKHYDKMSTKEQFTKK